MFRTLIITFLMLPHCILADNGAVVSKVLGQLGPSVLKEPLPQPEDLRGALNRRREAACAEVGRALKIIEASEKAGKPFPDEALKLALSYQNSFEQAFPGKDNNALHEVVRSDVEELLAVYAEELTRAADKHAAVRNLTARAKDLASNWLVQSGSDGKLKGLDETAGLEVAERNLLFDTSAEKDFSKELVEKLDRERIAYLEERVHAILTRAAADQPPSLGLTSRRERKPRPSEASFTIPSKP